ncbi:hypothetical protein AAFF_G00250390 [Aldrovandia affinis]|uniref:Uncharacterized protein n=1 Tax=Aldrovandia affinis TaxID=143900 RepID=A0AAD7W3C8_9TELE|nr:hypothetical protein AAFF_G00250390 [Aldrovandia affinis]
MHQGLHRRGRPLLPPALRLLPRGSRGHPALQLDVPHGRCPHAPRAPTSSGTPQGSVFEMKGEARYEGRGYKGRVQVAPLRFQGGDCSLLLRELRFSDAALYES